MSPSHRLVGHSKFDAVLGGLGLALVALGLLLLLGVVAVVLLAPPAPSPTPRETPWSWADPDRPIVCYFIGETPIPPCYLRPVEEEAP